MKCNIICNKLIHEKYSLLYTSNMLYYYELIIVKEEDQMKHIKTLNTDTLNNTVKKGGCGECQTSCQSACKTSCTVGNQTCEHKK